MFFVVGKIKGDVSGFWDESHEVIKHCEELTQKQINEYSEGKPLGTDINQIRNNRWIEIYLDGNNPYYDCIIFFNDDIEYKKNNKYSSINEELEKCISEYYKPIRRNDRINDILN